MHRMTVEEFRESEKLPLVVVLDNVRSLNNIGSIFRTSDAFRVERICLCGITATPPHREIHKTALGAEESVAWSYHEDTHECVKELKEQGYSIFAVEQVDDSIMLGTENGERRTENGERRTENGERRTENGERRTENGNYFRKRDRGGEGEFAAIVRWLSGNPAIRHQAQPQRQLRRRHRDMGNV